MKEFKLKKYASVDEIILASFQDEEGSLTIADLNECEINGVDIENKEVQFSYLQQKAGIEEQGHWGWVDENNTIHYWIGKEISLEELIHFFAHEIGHRVGEPNADEYKEEMRAESYGETAALAYQFAKMIKDKNFNY